MVSLSFFYFVHLNFFKMKKKIVSRNKRINYIVNVLATQGTRVIGQTDGALGTHADVFARQEED